MENISPIVGFVDHVTTVLPLDDLRAVSAHLFGLGLTPGWPLSEQPGFATAGIRLGNLNLEICAVDRSYIGLDDWLTFEPADLDTLAQSLKQRGLAHDPFDRVEAGGQPIYTRVGLPALATDETAIQVCRTFFPTRTTGPEAPPNDASIVHVHAIDLGVDAAHRPALERLIAPRSFSSRVPFSEGPALSIADADRLHIKGLTVMCKDTAQAKAALVSSGFSDLGAALVGVGSLRILLSEST